MAHDAHVATISFDDGGARDLWIIRELDQRKIRGTFYLPSCAMNEAFYEGMSKKQFPEIYQKHEVGAHGRLHRSFRKEPCNAREEICGNLADLLQLFGKTQEFHCFAYPYGDTTPEAREIVKCHFKFGRTVVRGNPLDVEHPTDRAVMPITGIFSRGAQQSIASAAQEGIPIHILAHPWEIGIKWDLVELTSLLDLILKEGYSFFDNLTFFERTLQS
jgi:peptidoglycan/xylan/chitin deacetylase (PgdA/CDA1 family)